MAITMYGTAWCGDCKRAKKFLGEQRIHYDYVDVEQDADGLAFIIGSGPAGLTAAPAIRRYLEPLASGLPRRASAEESASTAA